MRLLLYIPLFIFGDTEGDDANYYTLSVPVKSRDSFKKKCTRPLKMSTMTGRMSEQEHVSIAIQQYRSQYSTVVNLCIYLALGTFFFIVYVHKQRTDGLAFGNRGICQAEASSQQSVDLWIMI